MPQDFISDADMKRLEQLGKVSSGPSPISVDAPDFISDEDMARLEGTSRMPREAGSRYELTPEAKALEAAHFGQNVIGAGQAIGKAGMTAMQWLQDLPRQARELSQQKGVMGKLRYLGGSTNREEPSRVTPNPVQLEPNTPGQKLGQGVAGLGLYAAPVIATGGASLPAQVAAGGLGAGVMAASQGENPKTAAVIGSAAPVVMSGAQKAVQKIGQWAKEKEFAERIWNKVAGVPAGRKGVSVSMETGEAVTNPGRSMVRASEAEGKGPIKQVTAALTAQPNAALRVKAAQELEKASTALENHLALSNATLEIDLPLVPRAQQAVDALKLTMNTNGRVSVDPLTARRLQSEIGNRVNWNPATIPTEANELLKDSFFQIGQMIEKSVPGVKALVKPWQEAYLFNRALRHQIEKVAAGQAMPSSVAGQAVKGAVKRAIPYGGAGVLGYEILKSD